MFHNTNFKFTEYSYMNDLRTLMFIILTMATNERKRISSVNTWTPHLNGRDKISI